MIISSLTLLMTGLDSATISRFWSRGLHVCLKLSLASCQHRQGYRDNVCWAETYDPMSQNVGLIQAWHFVRWARNFCLRKNCNRMACKMDVPRINCESLMISSQVLLSLCTDIASALSKRTTTLFQWVHIAHQGVVYRACPETRAIYDMCLPHLQWALYKLTSLVVLRSRATYPYAFQSHNEGATRYSCIFGKPKVSLG